MKLPSLYITRDTGTESGPPLSCAIWKDTLFEGTNSVLIYNHFETEMLMSSHSIISKNLPDHFLQGAKPESKVLAPVKLML